MEFTEFNTLLPTAGVLMTLGSLYLTVRKIQKDSEKTKKEQAAEILQSAKEEDAALRLRLDNKIKELESRLDQIEINVEKDLKYMKESYSSELKNLGEKIESLRADLQAQHGSLLILLTKLIDNK